MRFIALLIAACFFFSAFLLRAAETAVKSEVDGTAELAAGHSRHGEAFNEGPRQQAYLMPGTGKIQFEVSSTTEGVRKFVEQGIGQLHGFWYFEAERSFRQAAMLDPNCAIAYWGMAKANANNESRAKELIQRAFGLLDHASPRERLYISALHDFLTSTQKKKEREAAYVNAAELIVEEYPDDLEAKALLGYLLYKYRSSVQRTHPEVDVVLDKVLAKEKDHPVHHYRIHLWDHKSPQRALDSAARCGPAAEGIAHMWHMCGHIFSRVKRYGDAAWFQEASARVDHRHMMHDRVLPDQIHNFAHNNEWFIRNMMNVGRVQEALHLAKNMIELPRHPKYNVLDKRNSASYGRDRLINVLERFELWDEAVALANSRYLEPTDDLEEQLKRLRLLGKAYAKTAQLAGAHNVVAQLEDKLGRLKDNPPARDTAQTGEEGETSEEAHKKREKDFKKRQEEHNGQIERVERDIACVTGYLALERGEADEALALLEKADEDALSKARVRLLVGEAEKAVDDAAEYANDRKKQVQPRAELVEICWLAGQREQARLAFIQLRANSNWIQMESPVFTRLTPIAEDLGFPADWRVQLPPSDDLGKQPDLDTLGPFRWQPAPAPDWILPDSRGQLHSLRSYRGKPLVIVFYLGYGCLHCAEQLQTLAPKTAALRQSGIEVIAISTDGLRDLDISQKNYDGAKMPFPLVADPTMSVFKAYRCYDDFEDVSLHGTFLIDARGRIRWQDISYDPFMDIDFLLRESKRLLGQDIAPPQRQELAKSAPLGNT